MNISIRPAVESDAERVAALSDEFAQYLKSLGDTAKFRFTAQTYRRDGFGPKPAFYGLVADSTAGVVGYLLYHFGYDVDSALRTLHIIDLYVDQRYRKHGAGKVLMMQAKQVCRDHGVGGMLWSVYKWNALAHAFYQRLGAKYINDLDYMYLALE